MTRVTKNLSHSLHTTVKVDRVDFSLFNKMLLQGTLVEDQHHDTLLYAGSVSVNITDWWFVKDKAVLQYVGMDNATVKLHRTDSVWNFQFLVDYFSSSPTDKKNIKKDTADKPLELDLRRLDLAHVHFLKKDEWRGENMDLQLQGLDLNADSINFTQKIARIRTLVFTRPQFTLTNYQGKRLIQPDTACNCPNDPLHLRLNPGNWDLTAGKITIDDGFFKNEKPADTSFNQHFDGDHIFFSSVNTSFTNLRLHKDTITAQLLLSTKERSGFEVKKLSARIKWFPEAMEFGHLDLQTGKSRLKNFFAMRFRTLDDMSDFVTRIHMEADFSDADVDSDDIAYFAPALKDWKKHIRISGNARGTVSDLSAKNALIDAGKNTYLNGNIRLKGLPDIDSTFIDFQSNDFRTTYQDMTSLVPSIRTIEQPRIDRVEWLRFKGSFKGTIHDFVTNGNIETNLGALVTNVNMKLLEYAPSVYSGTLKTDSFQLGAFLDNDDLGKISFQGSVIGAGLKPGTLNASLNGTINSLDFNQYTYHNIQVNGAVAKKKFNGEVVANDSALTARLNGLIDFSQDQPRFNFDAEVTKADLSRLNFLKQSIEFNGKFKCNFTGNNIDNFLGNASIYDASVYKNGQRVSFDSLTVESSIVDNNKTITVVSNEFDGAIVGEFSIHDLPAAFQTFLNKYYPSYIKPARTIPTNENFSFVVTTKKVDEYIDLIDKNLSGFNNANVSGRINTKDHLLDLNLELPSFSYKKIGFDNISLKGRGNLDSLSLETSIGQIRLNDSLRFPSTHLHLNSYNDLSSVQLTTSANQTLNSANLAATVQTRPTGVRVKFAPSTFDINSKTWIIDKDGELAFDNHVISANALRIHSGDQLVQITTQPSSDGSWNDIHIDLKKINIGDFTPYLVTTDRIEGVLSGSATMTDPLGKPTVTLKGQAEQFRLNNDSIGKLDLDAGYQQSDHILTAALHSDNKDYHFDVKSRINTSDSSDGPPIDITTDVSDTKVELLEKYLDGIFSNLSGKASGHLQIVGPANHLLYLGTVQLKDASLKVVYTQCTYKIPAATFQFKKDTIDFGTFQLKDKFNHTAELSHGRLYHHAFDDLGFDFEMNTPRLLLLDTKATDNNQFYGTVIGKARVTLTGPIDDMHMYIKGEPTDSSNIYLPPSVTKAGGDDNFVEWKVYGKEMKKGLDKKGTNFLVDLDMYANNYANVYMILDPLMGDIIKTNGHGALNMSVGTTKDLTLNGRYEIDKGNYNFTFQSFIHKPFILSENVGNYIQWSGNPYDATIGIQAIYKAENVRFSDLGLNAGSGLGIQDENVKRYLGEIIVNANLTGKLTSPNIAFEISLPPGSPLRNNQDAQTILQKIQDDPNELVRQCATLVAFNTFIPLSNSTNNFDATNAVGGVVVNSISGVLSNALAKWGYNLLQKMFNDKSLRVNFNTSFYNGTNVIDNTDQTRLAPDRTNLSFSVQKSIFNEKLTFTFGSALDIGMTAAQAAAASFQFLPDLAAEYKITPDGRVALTFFYRDSYNYLSSNNHTQNSSGTSISYRRDFDRIDELFKSKKKKKKEAPVPPPPPPPAASVKDTSKNNGAAN